MRTLPASLAAKLDAGVTTLAAAWRLTRGDGVTVAVTQHDRDVIFDGTRFVAAHSFLGSDFEKEINLAPDRTALSGALTLDAISETDLALGRWDQAKVEAFWVDWANPVDFIAMWTGMVAAASWRGAAFELDIVGSQARLNREIGRVYARSCDASLGDARCKIDVSGENRTTQGTLASVISDRSLTIAVPLGQAPDHFVGGVLTILAGPLAMWRSDVTDIVASTTAWTLSIARPFPLSPHIGDSLHITMGCDKRYSTCTTRFANGLNFRGQPTLPGDDVAFGGPAVSGNTGGKR